jgi:hypothetical protein
MATIDIGDAAIDRNSTATSAYTWIDLGNPANDTGTITSVEVWANTNITGLIVGTFYLVSGTTYKCRDSEVIGSVTAGSKKTFSVSIDVQAGDYIGCYFSTGTLEYSTSGTGVALASGEYIDPGDEVGYAVYSGYALSLYGTGVTAALVISPSGLSQPIAYGTPKLSLSIKPPGYQQAIAYGTPTVTVAGAAITIYPPGLQVVIAYGTLALRYPQTISPPGLNVPIAYGTLTLIFSGAAVIYVPGHQQSLAYGTPTILKYVFHLILDGRYNIESPETNRAYVIGRDVYGNPVYGEAHDSDESGLVGERLDFQQELSIPTEAQAADVASAVLAKMRLSKKRGVILIPYNCGQELWDVVQIIDAGANQSAVKFRVVGLRFEYHPKQARYEHKLILGAP